MRSVVKGRMAAPFISVDNMRGVLDRIQYELPRRDSGYATAAIAAIGRPGGADIPPVKQVVYDLMVDIARDEDFEGTGTSVKNEVVVDATVRYFDELARRRSMRPVERSAPSGPVASERPGETQSRPFEPRRDDARPRERADEGADADAVRADLRSYVDDPFAPTPGGVNVVEASDTLLTPEAAGAIDGGEFAGSGFGKSDSAPKQHTVTVRRCMSLDGQDRDLAAWPSRYHYSIDWGESLQQIEAVAVVSVVVPVQDHTVNAPFLLLAVDELSGLYSYNKNDSVRRCFTKLVPESTYASARGRSYVVLRPAFDDSVKYSPAMPALSRLTTKLMRPNGMLVSPCQDDLRVVKITQSSDGNWILEFDKFWPAKEFGPGDIVRVTGCGTGVDAVDRYMNRLEGHEVLEIGRPLADEGCNKVMIRFAGSMNRATGNYEKDAGATAAFDGTHASSDAVGEINVACDAINMSLQMSITVLIKCAVADSQLADAPLTHNAPH